jgi:hypothetical protein
LEWLGEYKFEIKDAAKWKATKEKFDILVDKDE